VIFDIIIITILVTARSALVPYCIKKVTRLFLSWPNSDGSIFDQCVTIISLMQVAAKNYACVTAELSRKCLKMDKLGGIAI
jgi:hypothetical protein